MNQERDPSTTPDSLNKYPLLTHPSFTKRSVGGQQVNTGRSSHRHAYVLFTFPLIQPQDATVDAPSCQKKKSELDSVFQKTAGEPVGLERQV